MVVSINSQDPYQYVLHVLQKAPPAAPAGAAAPEAAAAAAAPALAAADADAAATGAAIYLDPMIALDLTAADAGMATSDTTNSDSSSSGGAPSADEAATSSVPAVTAPAVPPTGTPVVVEVSGLLFKHSSKSVANNYAVYVQVRHFGGSGLQVCCVIGVEAKSCP